MRDQVLLFDIDGTLMDMRGAGLRALREAARELYDREIPELDLHGATDGGLIRKIFPAMGLELNEERTREYFATYLRYLDEILLSDDFTGIVLPGVLQLLEGLKSLGAVQGLLTGNIQRGAHRKVAQFELGSFFNFGAYGDDHHDRNKLGPVALQRATEVMQRFFEPTQCWVIGDTPRDIACGKALGARTLAVATGGFSVTELKEHNADLVMESFADFDAVISSMQNHS